MKSTISSNHTKIFPSITLNYKQATRKGGGKKTIPDLSYKSYKDVKLFNILTDISEINQTEISFFMDTCSWTLT